MIDIKMCNKSVLVASDNPKCKQTKKSHPRKTIFFDNQTYCTRLSSAAIFVHGLFLLLYFSLHYGANAFYFFYFGNETTTIITAIEKQFIAFFPGTFSLPRKIK